MYGRSHVISWISVRSSTGSAPSGRSRDVLVESLVNDRMKGQNCPIPVVKTTQATV